jgi:hypothetical protein
MNRAVEKDGGFLTGMTPAHLWLAVTTAIKKPWRSSDLERHGEALR